MLLGLVIGWVLWSFVLPCLRFGVVWWLTILVCLFGSRLSLFAWVLILGLFAFDYLILDWTFGFTPVCIGFGFQFWVVFRFCHFRGFLDLFVFAGFDFVLLPRMLGCLVVPDNLS